MSISLAEFPSASVNFYRDESSSCVRVLPQPEPLNLILYLPSSLNRNKVESFIHRQFKLKHEAEIRHYMPYLLSLEDSSQTVLSAAGFRPACSEKLFLEKYLDEPVERLLSNRLGNNIDRFQIIEVGNLASDCPGSSRLMIMAMTCLFDQHGFEWVVMTGTNELANIFRNLELAPIMLARAEASRLDDEQYDWGKYYAHDPQVMTGNIKSAHQELSRSIHYRNFINSLQAFNLSPCSKKNSRYESNS